MTFESCIIIIAYDTITFDRAENCFYKQKEKKGGLEFFFMYVCSLRKKREERVCEKKCIHKIALNFRTMRMMRKTFQMLRAESLNNV